MKYKPISWWRTDFGEPTVNAVAQAIRNERISQGSLTEAFEKAFAERLGVSYAIAVTSGSVALYLALLAKGIKSGDEVLMPDRTWVATAHAAFMLGAKPILLDTQADLPVMSCKDVEQYITPRTKAIIPVHLNGRGCDMHVLQTVAEKHNLVVIEDACQALFSKHPDGTYMGTKGDVGCFSLGTTKIISSGQGGVLVTNDEDTYESLRLIKNHGVVDQFTDRWNQFGFNFKFTDIQAAIVHQHLETASNRVEHLYAVHDLYQDGLSGLHRVSRIPYADRNELPLFVDVLVDDRRQFISYLSDHQIQCRPYPPSLHTCDYLNSGGTFTQSKKFNEYGVFIPSGPSQPLENVARVIETIRSYDAETKQ